MSKKISLLIFFITAFASLYLAILVLPKKEVNINHPDDPNAYAKNVMFVEMDMTGKPSKILKTQDWTHFERDDRLEIKFPTLTIFTEKEPSTPWKASADFATSTHGMKVITLEGNVVLSQADPENPSESAYHFITKKLTVNPKEKTMHSSSVVNAKLHGINAKTEAMNLSWETGSINLTNFQGTSDEKN